MPSLASAPAPAPPSESDRLSNEDLTTLRQNTDWRQLFLALGVVKDSKQSKPHDWWGQSPFKPTERTASFHLNANGWYCHATGQGGGSIELLQRLFPEFSCYDAGRWLLEQGVSQLIATARSDTARTLSESSGAWEPKEENLPIRQDLRPSLRTDHTAFRERQISPAVLEELGAGYLDRPPRKNGTTDPMNHRLVFQIRTVIEDTETGFMQPAIVGHIGRATSAQQQEEQGKWWTYRGFRKSLELYNLDLAMHDDVVLEQARDSGHILVVEGCFDVAKLYSADIRNVVATLGAQFSERQLEKLGLLTELTGVDHFLFWYDRDEAGRNGAERALRQVQTSNVAFEAESFDWQATWSSPGRGDVGIPEAIADPCDFSLSQLQWLRAEGII